MSIPVWALQECIAQHLDHCQVCVTGHDCELQATLCGCLEEVSTPVHVSETIPPTLIELLRRCRQEGRRHES